ncbi:class II aldolase/adducin family protein [Clostridium sp. 1001283B150225_161107_B6]|jgi:L-ribulose-5-phosphate 4-epimerase|uniref:class II aldolase/adducin family protein n=2 Tax=Clostridia TaxID=186801 RepID=UPI001A9BC87F|nr:class II aldolase/adducin family protein [Clostridium sp. 1001283B150225_161107_B6]
MEDKMGHLEECKREVVKYSHLLYERGLVTAAGGNVSMRCGDTVIVTASGVSLRDTREDNLILCDQNGKLIVCPDGLKPSKETIFHLKIYQIRQDVDSVIHVHPAYSVGYSINDRKIPVLTASAKMKVIDVPVVDYANPGTEELASYVEQIVKEAPEDIHAMVLKAHGIIAYEKGMSQCFDTAELVEDTAHIAYVAEMLSKNN